MFIKKTFQEDNTSKTPNSSPPCFIYDLKSEQFILKISQLQPPNHSVYHLNSYIESELLKTFRKVKDINVNQLLRNHNFPTFSEEVLINRGMPCSCPFSHKFDR